MSVLWDDAYSTEQSRGENPPVRFAVLEVERRSKCMVHFCENPRMVQFFSPL